MIWPMARLAASAGDRLWSASMLASTASTTTMASSTTMPIASTSASSDTMFKEKPKRQHHGEGADQGHRHRDQRDQRGAEIAQEQEDDDHHEDERLDQRVDHLLDALQDEGGRIVGGLVGDAFRELRLQALHHRLHALGGGERVGARRLEDRDQGPRPAVEAAERVAGAGGELDPRRRRARGRRSRPGWRGRRRSRTPRARSAGPWSGC